jgi:hypothetical protein
MAPDEASLIRLPRRFPCEGAANRTTVLAADDGTGLRRLAAAESVHP